jgi:hypothetical protein
MQVAPQETSIVIAGAWNPAILTPSWLMHHGLQNHEASNQMIQAMFPAGLNGAFDFPRFAMPGFKFVARPDSLILLVDAMTDQACSLVEEVGRRVLENLRHTPIGGLGHNFEFRHPNPPAEWLDVFSRSQLDLVDAAAPLAEVSRSTLATSFVRGGVAINVQRYHQEGALTIKFNFHHAVNSAAEAINALSGSGHERFWQNFLTAKAIVENLYGALDA